MAEDNGLLTDDVLTLLCEVSVVGQETTTNIKPTTDNVLRPVVPGAQLAFDLVSLLTTNSDFADVKFEVSEDNNFVEEILANRAILACRSPVFMAMFKKSKRPLQEVVNAKSSIKVSDMSPQIFKKMLNFIYTDKIPVDMDFNDTQKLLAAADKYHLERLKIICERKLCNFITVGNVCSILVRADMHGSLYLKEKCLEFINLNPIKVTETEAWNLMADQHPRLL